MTLLEDKTFYHVDGWVRLYVKGEETPGEGWQTEPWPDVVLRPEPLDHDANGKKGGSLPKARRK